MGATAQVAAQQAQSAAVIAVTMPGIQHQVAHLLRLVVAGMTLLAALVPALSNADAQSLRQMYATQRYALENNAFQAPIHLASEVTDSLARGDVYAVLSTPFDTLRSVMSDPAEWCELIILHVNVKACTYSLKPEIKLVFYVGHKEYETPGQAFALEYHFRATKASAEELITELTAPNGPFGTSDYQMEIEAIPLDIGHSFLHFSYAYNYNWVSRLAIEAYLATLGRDKVGFTVTQHDDKNQPIYIKGVQGIIERNSMRYFLAIQATLDTFNISPLDKVDARFNKWYDLIQRYPRQLVEYSRADYLANKQAEYKNQRALQGEVSAPAKAEEGGE